MEPNFYVIKAFSERWLEGNPAAVIIMASELDGPTMQRIAFINGFPETVFLLKNSPQPNQWYVWWFTSDRQVYDAGHATLAAQYVIHNFLMGSSEEKFSLKWGSNTREVTRSQYRSLNYCRLYVDECADYANSLAISGGILRKVFIGDDAILFLPSSDSVKDFVPDFASIRNLNGRGLAVTAPDVDYDYCSRFFAPNFGVDEDYVTATSHVYLSDIWMRVLGKDSVTAIQYSQSPGCLSCRAVGSEIVIQGNCSLYSEGKIMI